MKCVHTLRTGRHKRQADITLLFQYILLARFNHDFFQKGIRLKVQIRRQEKKD